MKLTWTDAIFSRTTMVLFLCRNKSSRNGTKLFEVFYTNNKNFWSQDPSERGLWVGNTHQGAPPLLARPGGLYPPGGPADDPLDTIKSHISRKNREKELSWSTRQSRRQALFFLGRADLESVWGSGEGDLRSSSSPTHLHHQFHDAPHREWVNPS